MLYIYNQYNYYSIIIVYELLYIVSVYYNQYNIIVYELLYIVSVYYSVLMHIVAIQRVLLSESAVIIISNNFCENIGEAQLSRL